ncbi:bifunctional [glutamate--ammonia ligase]-adenylyl-L-tyrosine phosphorylase/[glutamate--ammonia-ligase] adenylyltransferase [Cellvibrio sp. KY-GH-1]|uniref:bifunctional [glutamate--ammonia ligase]-adenylyl-L-tyrosine phosphorylase/[glutamate--ammonia-ligase] adenylyltransferase n=1 Tax=Cellvibrio sp. KY-GH-1 TaxID=2303332 RepID=UPI001246DFB0|nr:bifunctional [glutamate--ammonia ligase]-adenylyl-L-tyrosine phosphorylase/[glutamate--ammonia-ligase] adenylyltransferase [Cellvibrio sp. KY-GH-1]QEY17111.1 bifunctional [glutamate--ammonia ligase]-adenylyl-L-tyrosine phosphorylase/[glutamate--ammonia-ligase] adenylyltransferase [Cellvibrio sp. KY-GH-1]
MLNFTGVPVELQPAAQRFWEQFSTAIQSQNLSDPQTLLPESILAEEFFRQLTRAFVASEFIAKTSARTPALLLELIESGALFRAQNDEDLAAFAVNINAGINEADVDARLRRARNKAMIRVIWRDLNRLASMSEVTAELSRFADTSIQLAAEYHYRALEKIYGTPIGRESGKTQPFMVLGMGKLGAGELNISSDIDLIFTFPEGGETNHASRAISNQEFFVKLGQRLIKSLDTITAEGFVFRVDMRLRPHGESGSLAMSFVGMEDYYQTQGREWERYAMIKARTVAMAGGEQQEQARKTLRKMLQPFTYRQYIDFSAIESLREMKGLIARQVQRKGMNLDVKLGEGGIREVEFVVQVFQLIRGGRDALLRKRKVPVLLPILEQENYLPPGAGSALLEAYIFLRNTEHAIQGFQDKQTQALPIDPLGQQRLAWAMGFESWDGFFTVLSNYRQRVNAEFKAVIAAPDEEESIDQKALTFCLSLWEGSLHGEDAIHALEARDVEAAPGLVKNLADLRASRAVLSMQASGRTRLDVFIPRLLHGLFTQAGAGKLPLTIAETFGRIVPFIEAVARRTAYLVLLVENPTALQQLIRLCAASPWIADQLTQFPALLDELLTPESLYAPPDKALLRDELRRDVLRLTWDDLEGHMEALRYFRLAHGLRVAASEVTGALPLMKVSDYLTFIAEVVLEHVLQLSWEYMVERHGRPRRADGSVDTVADFVIVGYGKLGGIELSHGSDLDLVFIHNSDASFSTDGERSIDNLTFYTRLGQRIIHVLNTYTPTGKLYEVDMRLRPSGNSGMLVSSLAAFEKYQANEAWTWEHQALVRARVVAGSAALGAQFEAVRQRILSRARDLEQLRKDVADMRRKMREQLGSEAKAKSKNTALFNLKQDAGGIVDIEFMVQYAALAWASKSPDIIRYTDNIRILGSLEEAGLLDADSVAHLIAAYKAYRSTGHRLALQRQEAVLEGDNHFTEERAQVTAIWDRVIGHP